MARVKEKRERYLGEHLHLKGERCLSPKCAVVRKPYPPGVHGPRGRRRAPSEFGLQLREKQKFKISYGIDERNLRRIFRKAKKKTGSTSGKLLELLERRLDNVAFRLGFAKSRSSARQLVAHRHILVNGRKVRSPGFSVKPSDVVSFRLESQSKGAVKQLRETLKQYEPPSWLRLDKEKLEGTVLGLPAGETSPFEINLLVESFSK